MFSNFKNWWNSVRYDVEGMKIFSKEWFVLVLVTFGILGVIALFVVLCRFLKVDHQGLFEFLVFGAFCFFAGTLFGIDRAKKL